MSDDKPGRRTGQAQGGYWYARAIKASDLPMPSRCVALVLASDADNATGKITVSLSAIAQNSGASRRTVMNHLITLEESGFLSRRAPTSWQSLGRGEMTEYTLLIPPGYETRSGPTIDGPRAPRALPRAGDALPLGHMSAGPRAGDAHITTDLTSAAPMAAGAATSSDRALPASSPGVVWCGACHRPSDQHLASCWRKEADEELQAPRTYHCHNCAAEISLADVSLSKECKCGHTHTHAEHFPPADEADDFKETA